MNANEYENYLSVKMQNHGNIISGFYSTSDVSLRTRQSHCSRSISFSYSYFSECGAKRMHTLSMSNTKSRIPEIATRRIVERTAVLSSQGCECAPYIRNSLFPIRSCITLVIRKIILFLLNQLVQKYVHYWLNITINHKKYRN